MPVTKLPSDEKWPSIRNERAVFHGYLRLATSGTGTLVNLLGAAYEADDRSQFLEHPAIIHDLFS
jgi:hypothetical protein